MVRSLFAAAAVLMLGACASLSALPAVSSKVNSPRTVGVLMAEDFGPPLEAVADACEAGFLSSGAEEAVVRYGATLRTAIGLYASSARACVVADGRLQTDSASGAECHRGSVQRAAAALPSALKQTGLAMGGEQGREVYLAGLVASTFTGTGDGGFVDGFTALDDVPLAEYDAIWSPVQASADRLEVCATRKR